MAYRYQRVDEPTQAEIEWMYLKLGLGYILEQDPYKMRKFHADEGREIVAHQNKIREIANDKQS